MSIIEFLATMATESVQAHALFPGNPSREDISEILRGVPEPIRLVDFKETEEGNVCCFQSATFYALQLLISKMRENKVEMKNLDFE